MNIKTLIRNVLVLSILVLLIVAVSVILGATGMSSPWKQLLATVIVYFVADMNQKGSGK